jgi:thermitase
VRLLCAAHVSNSKRLKLDWQLPTRQGVRRLLAPGICSLLAFALAAPAAAQTAVPGELIVRFRASAEASARAETLSHRRAAVRATLGRGGPTLVRLQRGDSISAAATALERDPDVLWAEPNYVYRTQRTPNDPSFSSLWGLAQINAPAAWDTTTGSASVVVAVVDTGTAAGHPELGTNLWANPGEVADGDDDDGNGKVDDVYGWDAYEGDPIPQDDNGHGTHVAGTVGAQGDNSAGITGVAWDVSLMPIRASDPDGFFTTTDIVEAFNYACTEGARVVNGSFGGPGESTAIRNAIEGCPGTLFVFAAGNGGEDGVGDDNDAQPHYPCTLAAANVLCVAAAGSTDLASFSNYGRTTVHLAAPGVGILSTFPPTGYATAGGTSMASPHAAGAAALVASHRTALTAPELKNALMNGVTPLASLSGRVWTGGMLNVNAALSAATTAPNPPSAPPPPPPAPPAPPPPPDNTAPVDPAVASTSHVPNTRSADTTVEVAWSGAVDFGSGVDGYSVAWDRVATTVPDATKDLEETASRSVSAPLPAGTYWFHLRTRDNAGNWSLGTHVGPFVIAGPAIVRRCTVPRLRGKTLRAATTALKRAGCRLGRVKRAKSRVHRGRIAVQRPAAGRKVARGTRVAVTVSRGRV